MADHDPGDTPSGSGPGWLFRLNTTLGARLNTPAWMGSGENVAAAPDAIPPSPAAPDPVLPPIANRNR
jgi:hypothetical protein